MNKINRLDNRFQNNEYCTNKYIKKNQNHNQNILKNLKLCENEINKILIKSLKIIKNENISKEDLNIIKLKYPEIFKLVTKYNTKIDEFKIASESLEWYSNLDELLKDTIENINNESDPKQAINVELAIKQCTIDEIIKIYEDIKFNNNKSISDKNKTNESTINKYIFNMLNSNVDTKKMNIKVLLFILFIVFTLYYI